MKEKEKKERKRKKRWKERWKERWTSFTFVLSNLQKSVASTSTSKWSQNVFKCWALHFCPQFNQNISFLTLTIKTNKKLEINCLRFFHEIDLLINETIVKRFKFLKWQMFVFWKLHGFHKLYNFHKFSTNPSWCTMDGWTI